ncbi:MAG TPA: nucleotidyltransferase family protein [Vicinamibacteria bacterium]
MSKAEIAALRDWILTGEVPEVTSGVAAAAVEQGLAGLLLAGLGPRPGLVGSDEIDRLRDGMRVGLCRSLRLVHLAGRTQSLLAARGVRSLPLKGAALAESLYDSVGFRPMLDADLLVLDSWPDAVETLLVEGYRAAVRTDHATVFVCPLSGGILELHRSVTSCPPLFPMDANALWSRSLLGDGPVSRLPSTEDLLVHLCLHASFQHGLVLSLVQWLDFRRLFSRRVVDLDKLMDLASQAGAVAAVGLALRVAAVVVGAPVPETVVAAAPLPRRLRSWLERGLRTPTAFVAPAAPSLARLRFELAAGRRSTLVAATLHREIDERPRMRATGRRALHLARRWALPSLRSWRGSAS